MHVCAPVLFLVFNRPKHTRKSLERIKEAKPSRLYVHCDGPRKKNPKDPRKVTAVREITQQVDWECSVKYFFREQNMGLRYGVFEAINWFFDHEEQGIILEDDCTPDLSFFQFATELLDYYTANDSVMHIGALNTMPDQTANMEASYGFSQLPYVWGWAGWRRAWKQMLIEFDGLDVFEKEGAIHEYLPKSKMQTYTLDKFRKTRDGEIQSWAYAWHYSILKNQGLCIFPKANLVRNTGIGTDGATNTTKPNKLDQLPVSTMQFPLVHPKVVKKKLTYDEGIFYTVQKSRFRLALWSILHYFNIQWGG